MTKEPAPRTNLWEACPAEVRALIRETVAKVAPEVVAVFYHEMMVDPEASLYLDNQAVRERLAVSLTRWLNEVFAMADDDGYEAVVQHQRHVGAIHARINLPMRKVNRGLRIIKRELGRRLAGRFSSAEEAGSAFLAINDVLDLALDGMHDAYLGDFVDTTRHQQSLKLFLSGNQLAYSMEKLRTSLFDWLRRILLAFYEGGRAELARIPSFERSDFGLWLGHKAELTFGRVHEVEVMKGLASEIEAGLAAITNAVEEGHPTGATQHMRALNERVTNVAYLLSGLTDELLKIEDGRDPLTRLLSRRYFPAIFQRETELSIRHDRRFSVLMIDVDNFKDINDTHGHAAGDLVLSGVSEILMAGVRAGDFVFRYGGEEFLILLAETHEDIGAMVGEKLRRLVLAEEFPAEHGQTIRTTVSIGVATHDGHPDYLRTIKAADHAVYAAKAQGRNRVVTASQVSRSRVA